MASSFAAEGGPAELHVHHVHAGDHEDEKNGGEHRVNGLAQLAPVKALSSGCTLAAVSCRWFSGSQPPSWRDRTISEFDLIERHARPSRPMICGRAGLRTRRAASAEIRYRAAPTAAPCGNLKSFRHHPDDGSGAAVNGGRLPDDVRVAVEITLPDFVAKESPSLARPACYRRR